MLTPEGIDRDSNVAMDSMEFMLVALAFDLGYTDMFATLSKGSI